MISRCESHKLNYQSITMLAPFFTILKKPPEDDEPPWFGTLTGGSFSISSSAETALNPAVRARSLFLATPVFMPSIVVSYNPGFYGSNVKIASQASIFDNINASFPCGSGGSEHCAHGGV